MIHYLFWWQVAALIAGVALLPLLAGKRGPGLPRPASLASCLLLSDLFLLARTALFSLLNYGESTGLQILVLPRPFDSGPVEGFLYLALVSSSAWFLLAALLRGTGRSWERVLAIPYWILVGSFEIAFLLILSRANMPHFFYVLTNYELLVLWSFIGTKAIVAITAIVLLAVSLGARADVRIVAALALGALSEVADLVFRIDDRFYLALIPLHYIGYFGALVLLGRSGRKEAEPGIEVGLAERLAVQAALDPEEAELLGLVLSGKGNKEIAYELRLSLSAVKHRVQKLFRRLGVATRNELLARASAREKGKG